MYDYVILAVAVTLVCGFVALCGHYVGGKAYRQLVHQQRAEIDRLASELTRLTDRDAKGRFVRREPK